MSHQWMILAVAPCMVIAASPADAATPFGKQVAADARGTVRVSNVSGDITISAWDKPLVDVQGELGPAVERVEVDHDGDDVEIRVVMKERSWRNQDGWGDGEARLQIRLPVDSELDASTVSGTIVVNGTRGEQRLKSVSGDIRSDVTGEEVSAMTVSGRVDLAGTGKEQRVRATSVSGSVRLRRMSGDIEARSTSGSVDIEASNASDIHAGVVSGNLSVRGTLAADAGVELSAVSGSVKIAAQAPAGFRYEVSTFSGALRNCFGVDTENKDGSRNERRGWSPGARISGERGEARASIRARSHSGSIELCDR
jgi:DUF4097 and DUF4098 domain-containing protein YvlB